MARALRHGVEQSAGVRLLVVDGVARLGDRDLGAAEPLRDAHGVVGLVLEEQALHARLVVGAREEFAERFLGLLLEILRQRYRRATPRAPEACGGSTVALRHQGAREREAALRGGRLAGAEERAHRRRIALLVPQRVLGALAHHADARPARIGGNEAGEAVEVRLVIVAAQNGPLDQLARQRVFERPLDRDGLAGFLLAHEVERALDQREVGGRGRGGRGERERLGRNELRRRRRDGGRNRGGGRKCPGRQDRRRREQVAALVAVVPVTILARAGCDFSLARTACFDFSFVCRLASWLWRRACRSSPCLGGIFGGRAADRGNERRDGDQSDQTRRPALRSHSAPCAAVGPPTVHGFDVPGGRTRPIRTAPIYVFRRIPLTKC